ncbi:MAG: EpsI family protein [Desulfobacteraceae bacterium 4572_88]|nr:MAG: EpsI family protein [Desulfobacteraceae bacterium 4572_88]RLC07947.1 MAG: EpsI family protein [Deltaproteobacteria bacterium]
MLLKHTLIASLIMLLTLFFLRYTDQAEDIHPNQPFSTFPKQIAEWKGKESFFDEKIFNVLGVDDYVLCNYKNPEGYPVYLYIGFYQSQREGDLIHSPKNCMPGAGWNIAQTSIEELETDKYDSGKIRMIRLDLKKGEGKQVMLYWFHSRGRVISSEYMQKIYLVSDSILRHRTDGSFVRLIAPVINNDEEAAVKHLKDFAKLLLPILNTYIPS